MAPRVALALCLSLLAACDAGEAGSDTAIPDIAHGGAGGGGEGVGGATPGSGPWVGATPESPEPPLNTVGSGPGTGGWDGGGEIIPDSHDEKVTCDACCVAAPFAEGKPIDVRTDDSNSFASPLLIEALLPDWNGEAPLPVRKHEFLNLFAPDVDTTIAGDPLATSSGALPLVSPTGEVLLAFQVVVKDVTGSAAPRSIGVLVDTSPSSAQSVDTLLGALESLVDQLRPEDSLGIFSASREAAKRQLRPFARIDSVPFDGESLAAAVERELQDPASKVSIEQALVDALAQAQSEAIGRKLPEASVVLVTDGRGEISETLLSSVRSAAGASTPARVVGIGIGPARGYSDQALEGITRESGGAHLYFDGSEASEAFLEERMDELLGVAIEEVYLELRLPDGLELVQMGGSDIASADPSTGTIRGESLAPNGTMTFHHVLRWTGAAAPDPCVSIEWTLMARAAGEPVATPRTSASYAPLGDAFAGALATPSMIHGQAVVDAAAALLGPTEARLGSAVATLLEVRDAMEASAGTWQDHPLARLCDTLALACERRGVECGSCDVPE